MAAVGSVAHPPTCCSCLGSRAPDDGPSQFVKCVIAQNLAVIFSKKECPHCKLVKDIFKKLKIYAVTVELDDIQDGDAILGVLGKMTGATTVPRVFIGGKCIGGGCEVKALYESGKLASMLKNRLSNLSIIPTL